MTRLACDRSRAEPLMDSPPPAQDVIPHRPVRTLGLAACIALVMGNMIGSGVFLLPASLAPFGWNAVAGWIVTTAGTLVLAWVLAALTRARPGARDPAGFVTEAFGEVPAFLVGWIYWVSVWTAVVSIAVAAVSYLSAFIPAITAVPSPIATPRAIAAAGCRAPTTRAQSAAPRTGRTRSEAV